MSKCDCVAGCAGARAAAGVVTVGGRGSGAHDARNVPTLTVNPFTLRTQHSSTNMTGRRWPPFLTTCSDASKPYMILVALVKAFQNHILEFTSIRASSEEWRPSTSSHVRGTVLSSERERVN